MGKKITLTIFVETARRDTTLTEEVNKFITQWFPVMEGIEVKDMKLSIEKFPPDPKSKAARVSDASGEIENVIPELEDVKSELENWRDNLPEQFSEKADELDSAIDELDSAVNSAQEAVDSLGNVEIPGAFGR